MQQWSLRAVHMAKKNIPQQGASGKDHCQRQVWKGVPWRMEIWDLYPWHDRVKVELSGCGLYPGQACMCTLFLWMYIRRISIADADITVWVGLCPGKKELS